MAEIRKHNPDDADSLGKLVRDALGEQVRPTEPGKASHATEGPESEERDDDAGASASKLPSWPPEGQNFTF